MSAIGNDLGELFQSGTSVLMTMKSNGMKKEQEHE